MIMMSPPCCPPPPIDEQNHCCILLALPIEFCNISIVGFPRDDLKGGAGKGGKVIVGGKSVIQLVTFKVLTNIVELHGL